MAKVTTDGLGIKLSGKSGNAVFANTRYGIILRPRTQPKNPRTPAQEAARARLTTVTGLWKTLTPTQRNSWAAYGKIVGKAPYPAFVALSCKWLQVHGTGNPPLTAPASAFFGDSLSVTATGGSGKVVFTASAPNGANVLTELLLQPLAHVARAPKYNLYRPAQFVAYASGNLVVTVTVAPGAYAPAVRFVRSDTGQEAGMAFLGAVQAT